MKALDVIVAILVIIGGLNWGIIGITEFNVVEFLFSNTYVDRVIYTLVGIAALYQIFLQKGIQRRWKG